MLRGGGVRRVWLPPMRGRLKLNVDMACGPNKHGSGVGAVIRSANSDLVAAQVLFCQGCGPVEVGETTMIKMRLSVLKV